MDLYSNIKKRRKELKMTQQKLADLTGYGDRSSIAKIESGLVDISQSKLELFASVLHTTPGELLGWEQTGRAPLYEAAAGEGRIVDGYPTEDYPLRLNPDQILYKVKGQSMQPTLMDGDVVVVSLQSVIDYPRQIALVKVNGDEFTLKRVEKKDSGLLLIADNVDVYSPHFFTTDEVENLPVTILGVAEKLVRNI